MTRLPLPDPELIRSAPECATLALLDFGLALADTALRIEHPTVGADRVAPTPLPPRTLLLAELVVERCLELRTLIAHYNAAVDDALGLDDADSVDLPW
jgi:hypothetical protein